MAVYIESLIYRQIGIKERLRRFEMSFEKMEIALASAFRVSIKKFGMNTFKRTSMFGSNEAKSSSDSYKKVA